MKSLENDEARKRAADAASQRARECLQEGRPDLAIAEAERAIAHVLQHGLSFEEFVRLALRKAPAEILFRYERSAVATIPRLHLPLALRWEALRRAGRAADAREMRAVCIRLFPERASVWSEAGNQALDEQDFERAAAYFEHCLKLDPDWTAGLAGMAIVYECRKRWVEALHYRQRVVDVERALERDDAPSLQRVVRLAAALARLGHWQEAGVLFRGCLASGAYERLPAERPVFKRVFSSELYAPALIAAMAQVDRAAGQSTPESTPEVELALSEAQVFATAYAWVQANKTSDAAERLKLLGMCAWLAGDYEHAYGLLDEAEVEGEGDTAIQLLLAWSAQEIGAPDCQSIEAFALQSAEAKLIAAEAGADVASESLFYAAIAAKRLGGRTSQCAPESAPSAEEVEPADVCAELRSVVAQRVRSRTGGATALEAANATKAAIARLTTALRCNGPAGVCAHE